MSGSIGAVPDTAALQAARHTLANANAAVDQDRRNHSPSCVAFDQKQVDKADLQVAQAESKTSAGAINLMA
jgi:hypothetical protein